MMSLKRLAALSGLLLLCLPLTTGCGKKDDAVDAPLTKAPPGQSPPPVPQKKGPPPPSTGGG